MDIREASHPNEFKSYSTDRIRQEFLIQDLFNSGEIKLVYSLYDRMIAGGICPDRALTLEPHKDLGTDYFLERREMGIINVGSPGTVTADGQEYVLNRTDGLYSGKGVKDVVFSKKRGLSVQDMAKSNWVYRKLKNFRAGIEANISTLKRKYGLDRCSWSGWEGFKQYVWSTIVSYNLQILARLKLASA